MKRDGAFTLIELLVVLGIVAVITVATAVSLFPAKNTQELKDATTEIGTLLREAQSRSVNQLQGATWGVHFDNADPNAPFYALFSGTYSTSTRVGVYPLPTGVLFDPASLASGATLDITFAQITGLPSTSTAITLDLAPNGLPSLTTAGSLSRTGSGKIFFDNFNRTNL